MKLSGNREAWAQDHPNLLNNKTLESYLRLDSSSPIKQAKIKN